MKFELFYPVTPVSFNQHFGGNAAYYQANGVNIIGHNGDDLMAFHGQPIYAAHDGVAYYEQDDDAGEGVVVVSNDAFDYKGQQCHFKSIYWHMCDPDKEPKYESPVYVADGRRKNSGTGFPVKTGDLIGFADSTGLSTGDHLHFGLKPIVPGPGARSGDAPDVGIGNWVNVEQTNGYLGAIDPTPYFNGFFAPQAGQVFSTYQKLIALLRQYIISLQHPSI